MGLTWRQVGIYVSVPMVVAIGLVGFFLYGAQVSARGGGLLWAVLVIEAVWYGIFCAVWNSGNGLGTWVVDWITMFVMRAVLTVVVAGLVTVAQGQAFVEAFQQAYYVRVPLVVLQVAFVPGILYFPLFMPRLHPVAEAARPVEAAAAAGATAPVAALHFNPHDPRAASFEGILSMLSARVANAGGVVVSSEGLALASNLPSGVSAEEVAAYGGEMLVPLQGLADKMGVGRITQATVHSEAGTVTLVPAQSLMLITVVKELVQLGFSQEEAQQVGEALQGLWRSRYGD